MRDPGLWSWWSRVILHERYAGPPVDNAHRDLLRIVDGRDYFVLTTNVDHQFQRTGFDKQRLFYTQGDYGLFQCSVPYHRRTYDNYGAVRQMMAAEQDLRIRWRLERAIRCYDAFVREHTHAKVLYLEIDVSANTPGIIKYPFWQQVAENLSACYVQLNLGDVIAPHAHRREVRAVR